MSTFLGICFCINQDCKKREKCARALENYESNDINLISMAYFECKGKLNNDFIKLKKVKKNTK